MAIITNMHYLFCSCRPAQQHLTIWSNSVSCWLVIISAPYITTVTNILYFLSSDDAIQSPSLTFCTNCSSSNNVTICVRIKCPQRHLSPWCLLSRRHCIWLPNFVLLLLVGYPAARYALARFNLMFMNQLDGSLMFWPLSSVTIPVAYLMKRHVIVKLNYIFIARMNKGTLKLRRL